MRKRRRLANKMTIMVCAVLIAVSAFFYAPMEVEAGTLGPSIPVGSTYSFSFPSAVYKYAGQNRFDWEYYTTSSQVSGQYVYRDGVTNFNFENFKSSAYIPIAGINNGSGLYVTSGYAYMNFQFLITPHINVSDLSGMFSNVEFSINEINLIAYGKRYACNFTELADGSYSVTCYFLLDNNGIPMGLFDASIAIEISGNLSGFATCDSSYSHSSSSIYLEYDVATYFGDGTGFYYSQYFDDSVSDVDINNQTNTLNQATQNQTETMTNGFDNSQGDVVNSDLSAGLNEYQTAEDSLFATATTGMKDFTFFDIESVPAMVTGMSFITSIMGKWFNEAGGVSGVGIVLSILFSVMLVSMVLGLYRLYQSAGHRAETRAYREDTMRYRNEVRRNFKR